MLALTVLYDTECGLCRRAHEWAAEQTKFVELIFVPCASEEARKRFPQLDHDLSKKDLTVVADDGAVYFGPKAWLMVLWSLTRYRDWSYRLARPEFSQARRRTTRSSRHTSASTRAPR